MENHPIPQDVTGFQFKLIGDMTLRQFAYLATGCVLGWLFFASPLFVFIKYPVALLCISFGIGFAFVPISGRPMDTMLLFFIKSLFLPNQFLYQKIGGDLALAIHPPKHKQQQVQENAHSGEELRVFLNTLPQLPHNKLDEKENTFLSSLTTLFDVAPLAAPVAPQPQQAAPTPPVDTSTQNTPREAGSPESLATEEAALKKELADAKQQEAGTHDPTTAAQLHDKVTTLEEELTALMREKAKLEEQLAFIAQRMDAQKTVQNVEEAKATPQPESQTRPIPKAQGVSAGIPSAPDFPNVIMGIVKDPRGNILPNILVEITDKEGNPVRAFKTNNLGLFAAATPLQPGEYTILFEDPQGKHRFDPVYIVLKNDIVLPFEIVSMDAREDLRRELFGKTA